MARLPRIPVPGVTPTTAALAATAAAYLNGRYQITQDLWAIVASLKQTSYLRSREQQDRVNVFYRFEELATDSKQASKLFLVLPTDEANPSAKTEWTYAEAYELTLKYARWLEREMKVKKNEIIAMDFKNKPQYLWLWFALWSMGAIPAFINSNLQDNAFTHCVKLSTTRLLIIDHELSGYLTSEVRSHFSPDEKGRAVDVVILDPHVESQIDRLEPYRAPNEERSGATGAGACLLIYTSGTTGLPKAANVAWGKPLTGVNFFPKVLGLKPDDRYYTAMPLYHSSASVLCVCQALGPGCTIVLAPKFSPRTQMKQVSDTKATVIQYIGEMCRYLVTSPPTPYDRAHKVRLAFGNGMRPDVWQKFKDRFNIGTIVEFYGATEGPGASLVYSRNDFLRGAIGKNGPIAGALLGGNTVLLKHDHLTDEPWRNAKTGFCEKVNTNEPGELCYWLDPDNIKDKFQGYYGNEKASASKIIRDVFKTGDAYYRSGDLQRRDADGRWWFVDRIGDTFRWKGENVSTAEVSEALGAHAALSEANVYGVRLPHHDGRAGCAAIGLAEGQSLDAGDLGVALASHVRKRLPRYAVPLFLRLTKAFEVTGTMKHQKVALRNQGVDPEQTGEDQVYWLPPGSPGYRKFDKQDWGTIVAGSAKL